MMNVSSVHTYVTSYYVKPFWHNFFDLLKKINLKLTKQVC